MAAGGPVGMGRYRYYVYLNYYRIGNEEQPRQLLVARESGRGRLAQFYHALRLRAT